MNVSSRQPIFALLCASVFLTMGAADRASAQAPLPTQGNGPQVAVGTHHDTSKQLTMLPQLPPQAVGAVLRRKVLPWRVGSQGTPGDGALQLGDAGSASVPVSGVSFEGINNVNAVLPPDNVVELGA